MLEDATARRKVSVANSFKEIENLVQEIGCPVHLVPFGSRTRFTRIKSERELHLKTEEVLEEGFWGLVHVLKPSGKYPDEF